MSTTPYDRTVNFRANSRLIDAASCRAHERGMTLAELIRESIRAALIAQPTTRKANR